MVYFFNADNADFKTLWSHWSCDGEAIFSTKTKWLKKIGPAAFLSGLFLALFIFAAFSLPRPQKLSSDWELWVSCSLIPMGFILLTLLPITYFQSFIHPGMVRRKRDAFLKRHLPDAVVKAYGGPNVIFFDWKDTPFNLSYETVVETNRMGGISKKDTMTFSMLYVVKTEDSLIGESGNFKEEFTDSINAFWNGKPACENMSINSKSFNLTLKLKDFKKSNQNIAESLDMMIYMAKRFHLIPLRQMDGDLQGFLLFDWMDYQTREPLSENIKSISFFLNEHQDNIFYLTMAFGSSFNQDNYEWNEGTIPMQDERPFFFTRSKNKEEIMPELSWYLVQYVAKLITAGKLSNLEGIAFLNINNQTGGILNKEEIMNAYANLDKILESENHTGEALA